jgi:hypothetical protein
MVKLEMLAGRLFCPENLIKLLYTLLILSTTTASTPVQLQEIRQNITVNNYNFLKISLMSSKYFIKNSVNCLFQYLYGCQESIHMWVSVLNFTISFHFLCKACWDTQVVHMEVPEKSDNESFRVDFHDCCSTGKIPRIKNPFCKSNTTADICCRQLLVPTVHILYI